MAVERDGIKAWLREAIAKSGETATGLARKAGVAQTTITRFLNSDDGPVIGLRSLAKIAHAAGMQPVGFGSTDGPTGFAEGEGTPAAPSTGSPIGKIISALANGPAAVDPWVLQSNSLSHLGYLPGDTLLVNLGRIAKSGDIVCAQVYQWNSMRAETVFRLFDPPYLIAPTTDPAARRPLLVDGDRVIIKGVVEAMVRLS